MPRIGLINVTEEQIHGIDWLLAADSVLQDAHFWDAAVPGTHLINRMENIVVVEPANLQQMLANLGDTIGRDAEDLQDLSQLPPAHNEPSQSAIASAGRAVSASVFRGIQTVAGWISNLMPDRETTRPLPSQQSTSQSGGNRDGVFARIAAWAAERLSRINENVVRSQNLEMDRLMSMLDSDPDRGLKFALPLSDKALSGLNRLRSASSWLAQRLVDFNLGNLFGNGGNRTGGSVVVENTVFDRLRQKYRELAIREMDLGRFRRAAYIYAELLGDFRSAANCLFKGKFFAEAAVLYKQKLNDQKRYIECLIGQGLYEEAADYFVARNDFLRAAKIFESARMHERAVELYQLAADEFINTGRIPEAAELLQRKAQQR